MKGFVLMVLCAATAVCSAAERAETKRIYVSPAGSGKGSQGDPMGSLRRAGEAVAALRKAGHQGDVDVLLTDGIHVLEETLVLGLDTGAPEGARTRFAAAQGASPVISGGRVIAGWKKWKNNIWTAEVPWAKGGAFFHCLYDGDTLLQRARSKPVQIRNEHTRRYLGPLQYRYEFLFEPGALTEWENLEDIELYGKPSKSWVFNYLPIAELDNGQGRGRLAIPATYTMAKSFVVENCVDDLDEPGEWALDSRKGLLYYWPKSGAPGERIIAPVLDELVRVEGITDSSLEGSSERPVQGIVFEGLHFKYADRQKWTRDDVGIQHDWNMWDKANGLLRFRSARNCTVTDCRFSESGSDGVRLDLFCQNITVQDSVFARLGGTAILLCGYGPGQKDVNRHNQILNNHITQTGTLFLHSPAVFVWQSGSNRIAHNYISDLPYSGIMISGVRRRFFAREFERKGIRNPHYRWEMPDGMREIIGTIRWDEIDLNNAEEWQVFEPYMHARNNVIEFNELSSCMKELRDGNSIYLSAHGYGNEVRYNVLYDLRFGSNIRTDDDSHFVTIHNNLLFGTSNPEAIGMKGFNTITNNVLINSFVLTGKAGNTAASDAVIARNIFYWPGDEKPEEGFHRMLNHMGGGLDHNLYYCKDLSLARSLLKEQQEKNETKQADRNSLAADPMFVDAESCHFDFKPGAPARELGIKPLTKDVIGKMGRESDPFLNRFDADHHLKANHRR